MKKFSPPQVVEKLRWANVELGKAKTSKKPAESLRLASVPIIAGGKSMGDESATDKGTQ